MRTVNVFDESEKPTKSRNKPGQAETAKRGAVTNFQAIPNGVDRPRVCIRCGDPSQFARDCPHPYRAVLGPQFSTTFAKKTPAVTHLAEESAESQISPPNEINPHGRRRNEKRVSGNPGRAM